MKARFLLPAMALLAASPALAQRNQPYEQPLPPASYPGAPPMAGGPYGGVNPMHGGPVRGNPVRSSSVRGGAAYNGPMYGAPMQGGMPHEIWIDECGRRLYAHGVDPAGIGGTCESWWAFYQNGGAPDPTYGYAVPVTVRETREIVHRTVIVHRVVRRPVVRHPVVRHRVVRYYIVHRRRTMEDKLVRIR